MGRATEILGAIHSSTIPTIEQVFSLDITDPEVRAEIVELRKQAKKQKPK